MVDALKERRAWIDRTGGRFRSVLIVVEVALSVILLVGSGLLLISFLKLQRTPPGFDPDGVATAIVRLPRALLDAGAAAEFYAERSSR